MAKAPALQSFRDYFEAVYVASGFGKCGYCSVVLKDPMKAYVASGGLILGSVFPTVVVMVLSRYIPTLVLGVSPTIVAAWLLEILEV